MKTKRQEIKLFQESAFCDCGGEYKSQGIFQINGAISCPHICDKCGNQIMLQEQYPKIIQKVLDIVEGEFEIISQGEDKNEEN